MSMVSCNSNIYELCLVGSMNWSKAGLNSNDENIEVHYRKESESDEIRHQIYAKYFERKWRRNITRSQKVIAAQHVADAEMREL